MSEHPRSVTTLPTPLPAPDSGVQQPPYVTVVLPAYNEQDHVLAEIERICAALDDSELTYEVLAIDDASTDSTLEVLREAERRFPCVSVLAFRRNGGSGTARRIGTQQARGEVVVWTDADMTYPNERIPELVRILRDDESYDQVVGARTTEEGTHKILRVPAKWLIRKVAERLTNQRIPDLNSGLRAFRRSVSLPYLRLLPPGFSCVTTITLAFLSNQHDIRYVDISYAKRAGTSKFHFTRDAYRYILQVLRMVMYFDPLKVLMPPALWLVLVGFVKAVVDMVRHPFYFPASTVLLVMSGLLIGSLALLSDLVVRSRDGV
jgi:glycosyltransferase involved in cell wall biosynthesis